MFKKFNLNLSDEIFNNLLLSSEFEEITKGRKGANLFINEFINKKSVPIVRTTTIYKNPIQKCKQIHYNIINEIKKICLDNLSNSINFNNALIEVYDNKYTKMNFHTDQSLDLENNSYICLFSCYKYPKNKNQRTLVIKNKITNENLEIELDNNSIVIFSTEINKQYLHKIILKNNNKIIEQEWIGITFRLSKTFIDYCNPCLTIANEIEKKEFLNLKKEENNNIDFIYPNISYTINPSDLLPPIK